MAADIVSFTVVSESGTSQSNVPVTIGHVFKKGDVPAGGGLTAKLADNTVLALQVDEKATHGDGSLRHAVITVVIPSLDAFASKTVTLSNAASPSNGTAIPLSTLLSSGFTATAQLTVGGTAYTASMEDFLQNRSPDQWLAGSQV